MKVHIDDFYAFFRHVGLNTQGVDSWIGIEKAMKKIGAVMDADPSLQFRPFDIFHDEKCKVFDFDPCNCDPIVVPTSSLANWTDGWIESKRETGEARP